MTRYARIHVVEDCNLTKCVRADEYARRKFDGRTMSPCSSV